MKLSSTFIRYDLSVIARIMTPVFCLALVAIYYDDFVLRSIQANRTINGLIIVSALCGVVLIMARLISLQRDMSALDRFYREAQATGDMKGLIDMPWLTGRAIRHYLENLAHTEGTLASQLDQDAIQNELEALSAEYNSKLELSQFLVGFMIAMGLLGTFIGLLTTLTGISGMLDGMGHGGNVEQEFSKMLQELRKPLAGMGIAFSSSMFGLVTSLMLSIMMISLRRYMSRVMEKARSVMHKLLTRAKANNPSYKNPYMAAVGGGVLPGVGGGLSLEYLEAADKVSEAYFKTQDSINTMANNISLVAKKLDSIARAMNDSMELAQKTNDLLSFGPRMAEMNERLVEGVMTVISTQGDSQKIIQKIVGSLIQIDQSLLSNSPKELVLTQREATTTLNEMFSNSQTHTRLFSEMLEGQREGTRDLVVVLKSMNERLVKQEGINAETAKQLQEIKELFQKANNFFLLIEPIAENIGKQTLLAESSVSEERNANKALVSGIQRELGNFTGELRQVLGVEK